MSTNLQVVELPTGPTPPCTWFVDLPCDDLAVAVLVTAQHRAPACDRCLRLALETAAGVDRSKR